MLILGLESSGQTASCALAEQTDVVPLKHIAEFTLNTGLKHSETLLPIVEDMLRECGYEPKDIAIIAVSAGPGSFTGIRIGCAAAKGLAWAAGAKIIPVSSLEAIAYSSCIRENAVLSSEIDARNGFVYNALFEAEQGSEQLRRLTPDRVIMRSELAQNPEPIVTVTNVTAKGVILASIGKAFGEAEPVYLRPSQAERMRGKE